MDTNSIDQSKYYVVPSTNPNGQTSYQYYDSTGNIMPTNPIGGDQYKNNPQGTPGYGTTLLSVPDAGSIPSSQANPSAFPTPTTTSGAPGSMDDASFYQLMNGLNTGFQQNNQLVSQKNIVMQALLGNKPSDAQLASLPSDVQSIVQGGNRDQLLLQAQILNDSVTGKNASIASSIGYLTSGYQNAQAQYQTDLNNVLNYSKNLGVNPSDVIKALYPSIYNSMPVDQRNALDSLNISGTAGAAGSTGSFPTGAQQVPNSAAAVNNATGIKDPSTGTFQQFSDPSQSITATASLLQSYMDGTNTVGMSGKTTLDQATNMYTTGDVNSVGGYSGKDVANALGVSESTPISQLDPNQWANAIAQFETGYTSSTGTNSTVQNYVNNIKNGLMNISSVPAAYKTQVSNALAQQQGTVTPEQQQQLNGLLSIYKTTGVVPAMGMQGAGLRTQFYQAIGGQGQSFVSQAQANKATLSGATSALKTQETQYAANQTSLGTLDKQLALLQSYSGKVDRSGNPVLNKYLLYLNGQVAGDADTQALQNIVLTASTEFAKILSGASASISGVTVSSAQDAQNLLNANMTPDQINTIVGLMQTEGNYRLSSQENSIQQIQSDIANIGSTDSGTGGGGTTTAVDPSIQTEFSAIQSYYTGGKFNIPGYPNITTREQVISSLAGEYPNINESDISNWVYQTFPDQK